MPDPIPVSDRVQIINAYFDGFQKILVTGKDWLVVLVSLATLYIQTGNSSKLDVQAAKTDSVKVALDTSTKERDVKLEHIAKTAKEGVDIAKEGTDTVVAWKASYEKPKEVAAKAEPQ